MDQETAMHNVPAATVLPKTRNRKEQLEKLFMESSVVRLEQQVLSIEEVVVVCQMLHRTRALNRLFVVNIAMSLEAADLFGIALSENASIADLRILSDDDVHPDKINIVSVCFDSPLPLFPSKTVAY